MVISVQSVYIEPAPYFVCILVMQIAQTPASIALNVWCGRN
jgi:hypothetical protein